MSRRIKQRRHQAACHQRTDTICNPLALSVLGAMLCTPVSAAEPLPSVFSLHGFGTLGVVGSNEDQADVVANAYLQPDGAGHTDTWFAGVDSKLGAQVDARISANLSGVVQVVSKRGHDGSWTPGVEWANVKYMPQPGLALRAGRTVSPTFMLSDTANVGYANPWVRGPQEVYGMVPITYLDGVDLTWNTGFGEAINAFQASFGGNTFDAVNDTEISGDRLWILSNTIEYSAFTMRLGYLSVDLTFDSAELDRLFGGFSALGAALSTAGATGSGQLASALADRYAVDDTQLEIISLGTRYAPGNWLFLGEWARISDAGLLPRTTGWYATAGYRMRKVMPYVTYATLDSEARSPSGIPLADVPGDLRPAAAELNAALAAALQASAPAQDSIALGVRWEVLDSAALKFEYQHIDIGDRSAGRLGNVQPGFEPGGEVDLLSVTFDFVF